MMIMGVDYHPGFQEIAFLVQETGEYDERSLKHSNGEAERFYRDLKARGISARVGIETTGYSRWFERLLAELGFEVWIGDVNGVVRAKNGRKEKRGRKNSKKNLTTPTLLEITANLV
jgi:transposase